MLLGIIGKPSSGKSTLLNALCLTDAKMGDYPFTTIEANKGVAFVRVRCPCSDLEGTCNPRSGTCVDGTRYVPIEMLDVAGLVPGASDGKGMGNKFLDDLRQADMFIHVVDASGTTDAEGNKVDSYDPNEDITWVNAELDAWVNRILFSDWERMNKKFDADRSKIADALHEKLTGLGATIGQVKEVLRIVPGLERSPREWTVESRDGIVKELRVRLFPMVIAANKIDRKGAEEYAESLIRKNPDTAVIPTSGLAELTLRNADKDGVIEYYPGSADFNILKPEDKHIKVVSAIKEKILDVQGSTGVVELLETATFKVLKLIAVFPVEDATHLTDKDGRILPDVYLVPQGTTAKELAGKVHTDLADRFIHGILVNKSNKRVSASQVMEHGDILKIVSAAK